MPSIFEHDPRKVDMIVKRVSVPVGLEELMEGLTKEVLLRKPKDLYVFASEYFSRLIVLRQHTSSQKPYPVRTVQSVTKVIKNVPQGQKTFPRHLPRKLSEAHASKSLAPKPSEKLQKKELDPKEQQQKSISRPVRSGPSEAKKVGKLDRKKPDKKAMPIKKASPRVPKTTSARPILDSNLQKLNLKDKSGTLQTENDQVPQSAEDTSGLTQNEDSAALKSAEVAEERATPREVKAPINGEVAIYEAQPEAHCKTVSTDQRKLSEDSKSRDTQDLHQLKQDAAMEATTASKEQDLKSEAAAPGLKEESTAEDKLTTKQVKVEDSAIEAENDTEESKIKKRSKCKVEDSNPVKNQLSLVTKKSNATAEADNKDLAVEESEASKAPITEPEDLTITSHSYPREVLTSANKDDKPLSLKEDRDVPANDTPSAGWSEQDEAAKDTDLISEPTEKFLDIQMKQTSGSDDILIVTVSENASECANEEPTTFFRSSEDLVAEEGKKTSPNTGEPLTKVHQDEEQTKDSSSNEVEDPRTTDAKALLNSFLNYEQQHVFKPPEALETTGQTLGQGSLMPFNSVKELLDLDAIKKCQSESTDIENHSDDGAMKTERPKRETMIKEASEKTSRPVEELGVQNNHPIGEDALIMKRRPKIGDIDQVASVIEVVNPTYGNEAVDRATVNEYLATFLENEQTNVFVNWASKKQRPQSQTILFNERNASQFRRTKSVGLIKTRELESRSRIPTSARRSAVRRPLVRQLEANSKELEEKLNSKESDDNDLLATSTKVAVVKQLLDQLVAADAPRTNSFSDLEWQREANKDINLAPQDPVKKPVNAETNTITERAEKVLNHANEAHEEGSVSLLCPEINCASESADAKGDKETIKDQIGGENSSESQSAVKHQRQDNCKMRVEDGIKEERDNDDRRPKGPNSVGRLENADSGVGESKEEKETLVEATEALEQSSEAPNDLDEQEAKKMNLPENQDGNSNETTVTLSDKMEKHETIEKVAQIGWQEELEAGNEFQLDENQSLKAPNRQYEDKLQEEISGNLKDSHSEKTEEETATVLDSERVNVEDHTEPIKSSPKQGEASPAEGIDKLEISETLKGEESNKEDTIKRASAEQAISEDKTENARVSVKFEGENPTKQSDEEYKTAGLDPLGNVQEEECLVNKVRTEESKKQADKSSKGNSEEVLSNQVQIDEVPAGTSVIVSENKNIEPIKSTPITEEDILKNEITIDPTKQEKQEKFAEKATGPLSLRPDNKTSSECEIEESSAEASKQSKKPPKGSTDNVILEDSEELKNRPKEEEVFRQKASPESEIMLHPQESTDQCDGTFNKEEHATVLDPETVNVEEEHGEPIKSAPEQGTEKLKISETLKGEESNKEDTIKRASAEQAISEDKTENAHKTENPTMQSDEEDETAGLDPLGNGKEEKGAEHKEDTNLVNKVRTEELKEQADKSSIDGTPNKEETATVSNSETVNVEEEEHAEPIKSAPEQGTEKLKISETLKGEESNKEDTIKRASAEEAISEDKTENAHKTENPTMQSDEEDETAGLDPLRNVQEENVSKEEECLVNKVREDSKKQADKCTKENSEDVLENHPVKSIPIAEEDEIAIDQAKRVNLENFAYGEEKEYMKGLHENASQEESATASAEQIAAKIVGDTGEKDPEKTEAPLDEHPNPKIQDADNDIAASSAQNDEARHQESEESDNPVKEVEDIKAATKIQAAWKGFVIRKLRNQSNIQREENLAAVRIQAVFRGFLDRMKYQKLKHFDNLGVEDSVKDANKIEEHASRPLNWATDTVAEKPDFYRSNTVVEPLVTKTTIRPLSDDQVEVANAGRTSLDSDANNNSQEKTELEQDVKEAVESILRQLVEEAVQPLNIQDLLDRLPQVPTHALCTEDQHPDDLSSVGSADSVVTVVPKPKDEQNKKLSTSALDDRVQFIDHVQNSLLDQLSGKRGDSFQVDHLEKEFIIFSRDDNPTSPEPTEYLSQFDGFPSSPHTSTFASEEDQGYETRAVRTPLRDLPDIEEESETKEDEAKKCAQDAELIASTFRERRTDGLQHTSELHDSAMGPVRLKSSEDLKLTEENHGLRHTSELHDTVVATNGLAGPNRVQTVDSGNQTVQQAPAGVEAVTSRRFGAQASLTDTAPGQLRCGEAASNQSQSSRFGSGEMESGQEKTRRNNALNSNEKKMETQAATKIQAGFRGYQVRKQIKAKNAAIDQKRQLRKRSSRENMKDADLEEKSAVKIQAGVRGFLVRRRQKKVNSSASA